MKKHTTLNQLMALAIGVLVLSSCGTMRIYDGPKKGRSEIATLIVIRPALPFARPVSIYDVDHSFHRRELAMRDSIELLPGHHEINVGHAEAYNSCGLGFEAEAGKTYAVIYAQTYGSRGPVWSAFLRKIDDYGEFTKKPVDKSFQQGTDIRCSF
jgi:hypothetical protein